MQNDPALRALYGWVGAWVGLCVFVCVCVCARSVQINKGMWLLSSWTLLDQGGARGLGCAVNEGDLCVALG